MGEINSIAVVGSGSVGGYYGAKLALKEKVSFLMRRDLKAARESGLTVESPDGDFHLDRVRAFGTAEEIGPVDLVIIALKTTSNDLIPSIIPPLLKSDTRLLTLQNGLGNEPFLHQHFPDHPVLGGMCFVCINRGDPGVIRHIAHGRVEMGEFTEKGELSAIAEMFHNAGIDCRKLPDLNLARWRKLVWNIPFNGLSIAAGNLNTSEILERPALVARVRSLMHEVIDIAGMMGHVIDQEFAEGNIEGTRGMGPYEPSSLIDFKAGNPVEVEAIWGKPLSEAKRLGVEAPEIEKLHFEICEAIENR